jgi:hypothetical protein
MMYKQVKKGGFKVLASLVLKYVCVYALCTNIIFILESDLCMYVWFCLHVNSAKRYIAKCYSIICSSMKCRIWEMESNLVVFHIRAPLSNNITWRVSRHLNKNFYIRTNILIKYLTYNILLKLKIFSYH